MGRSQAKQVAPAQVSPLQTILVAEDNPIAAKLVSTTLSREGYRVETAADGAEALHRARQLKPDLILSDILMPHMDGFALCRAIKEDRELNATPVVFYTQTFLDPEDEALAQALGASLFIPKSASPEHFLAQIREVLNDHRLGRLARPEAPGDERRRLERLHQERLIDKLTKKVSELETERAALAESEAKFRQVVETIPDTIAIHRASDMALLYVSPNLEALNGITPAQMMAEPDLWLRMLHPDDRPEVERRMAEILQGNGRGEVEARLTHAKSGEMRWIEWRINLRYTPQGDPDTFVVALTDITERKRDERIIREKERELTTLLRNLPGMAYRCRNDRDWTMEFVSEGSRELTGYAPDELINNRSVSYAQLIHPEDRDQVWQAVQTAVRSVQQYQVSYRLLHRDGSVHWAWEQGIAVPNPGGRTHLEGFVADITAQKQADEALAESEARYRGLFATMLEGMALHEVVRDGAGAIVDYRFVTVNPSFERMTGLSREQVVGRRVTEVIPDLEREWIERYAQVVESGEPIRFQQYSAPLDRHFEVASYRTGKESFATLFHDVTQRIKAEKEMENLARFPDENPSPVLRVSAEGELLYANSAAQPVLTYCGCTVGQPVKGELRQAVDSALNRDENTQLELETEGRIFSFILAPVVKDGYANLYGRDITDRKRAEQSLARLNRTLRTLSYGNEALVRAENEMDLLQRVCEAIVRQGRYRMAWVGYADEHGQVRPMVNVGEKVELLQCFVEGDERAVTCGAVQRALDERRTVVVNDLTTDPSCREREVADKHGFRSNIVLPLTIGGEVLGVLGLYAERPDAFDEDEVHLFEELAADLSFGINAQRIKVEQERGAHRLQQAMLETIRAVALTVEKRDPYTAGHQQRVSYLATAIAAEMGLDDEQVEGIRLGSLIHDIGKIYVPAEILNRPGRLSEAEFGVIKSHPDVGFDIVKDIAFPWPVAAMIHQHHERLDGSGYPQGLQGEAICLEARILAVADVVEAITSHRPYRPSLGVEVGLEEIKKHRGRLYDPVVVDACLTLFEEKNFVLKN